MYLFESLCLTYFLLSLTQCIILHHVSKIHDSIEHIEYQLY